MRVSSRRERSATASTWASTTCRIRDPRQIAELLPGEILVTEITDPDWEPIMKKAAGIVTERGGRTSHAAIVARELGIPAVVGAKDAMSKVPSGSIVTISCAQRLSRLCGVPRRARIDSVSLSPDALVRTTLRILEVEARRAAVPEGPSSRARRGTPDAADGRMEVVR